MISMALFKISKGLEANLPEVKTPGYCWYTTDSSLFYVDFEDENGEVQRKALNAKDTETLMGASLATVLNNNELEIPTSSAVFRALADNLNAAKAYVDEQIGEHEHSWNELTDKPFYETTENVLRIKSVIPVGGDTTQTINNCPMEIGKTYIVEFDGVSYTRVAAGIDSAATPGIGNASIRGIIYDNTGEPFLLQSNGFGGATLYAKTFDRHNVTIYSVEETIKTLDPKYLPEEYATVDYVDEQIVEHIHSWNDLVDKPFGETVEKVSRGHRMVAFGGNKVAAANLSITTGKTYIIEFEDGDSYTCVATEYVSGHPAIGNPSIKDATLVDTGEPFYFEYDGSYTRCYAPIFKMHSFTMYVFEDVFRTLDPKYLPEEYATTAYVDEQLATKADADHTHSASDVGAYSKSEIDNMEFITVDDIDVICGGVTEGALTQTDVDELMAELNPEEVM